MGDEIPDAQPVVYARRQDFSPRQRAEVGRVHDLAVLQDRQLRHVVAAALACKPSSTRHDAALKAIRSSCTWTDGTGRLGNG